MAHKTPSNDKKRLLKVVFDKTAFGKFKISLTRLLPNVWDFQKENHTLGLGYGFKNLEKIYSL